MERYPGRTNPEAVWYNQADFDVSRTFSEVTPQQYQWQRITAEQLQAAANHTATEELAANGETDERRVPGHPVMGALGDRAIYGAMNSLNGVAAEVDDATKSIFAAIGARAITPQYN